MVGIHRIAIVLLTQRKSRSHTFEKTVFSDVSDLDAVMAALSKKFLMDEEEEIIEEENSLWVFLAFGKHH